MTAHFPISETAKFPRKKTVGLMAFLMLLSFGASWGAFSLLSSNPSPPTETETVAPIALKIAVVERLPVEGDRVLTGTVEAMESVTLASRVMGFVQELPVEEGDRVDTGQLIAYIDVADIQAQQNEAAAAIPQAQAGVSMAQSSVVVAQSQESQARSQWVESQAQWQAAQAQLNETEFRRDEAIARRDELEARGLQAEAQLLEAQADLEDAYLHQRRMAMLQADGAVSQSQLDEANTRVAMSEARVEQIRSQIQQSQAAIGQAEAQIQQSQAAIDRTQAQIGQAQAQIQQSEAQMGQAEAQVEQARAHMEQARAQVDRAMAGVDRASADLDYGTVTAPFSGVVTRKYAEVGSMAGAGQSLVTIESVDRLRFSVPVPESLVSRLQLGQTIPVQIDALDREVEGEVTQIIPAANTSHNFTIKIALSSDSNVLPGMFGRVRISTSDRSALMVPETAIVERLGIAGVYKMTDGRPEFQTVTTGNTYDGNVEIFSGVQLGDRVVEHPEAIEGSS